MSRFFSCKIEMRKKLTRDGLAFLFNRRSGHKAHFFSEITELPSHWQHRTDVLKAFKLSTAMMPRDMYAEVLRPIVDVSPLTAVTELSDALINDRVVAGDIVLFVGWFAGLIIFSLVILARKTVGSRR